MTVGSVARAETSFKYECVVAKGDDGVTTDGDPLEIKMTGNEMTTSLTGTDQLTLNENYVPRAANKGYVEFAGASIADAGAVEVLVTKAMLKGAKTGKAKIRARGEGFEKEAFTCKLQ